MTIQNEKGTMEGDIPVAPVVAYPQEDASAVPIAAATVLPTSTSTVPISSPNTTTGFTIQRPQERTIEVVAPSDLAAGFEFFVDSGNNSSLKVQVVREAPPIESCFSLLSSATWWSP